MGRASVFAVHALAQSTGLARCGTDTASTPAWPALLTGMSSDVDVWRKCKSYCFVPSMGEQEVQNHLRFACADTLALWSNCPGIIGYRNHLGYGCTPSASKHSRLLPTKLLQ